MLSEPLAAGCPAQAVPGSEGSQVSPHRLLLTCQGPTWSQPHTVTAGTAGGVIEFETLEGWRVRTDDDRGQGGRRD